MESRQAPWKLWHLAVVVLVAALMLGGLVAAPVVSSVIGVFAVTCFGSARIGSRVARGPLDRLRRWGVWRGGVAGFLAWLLSSLADAAILVGSVAAGLTAALGLVWLVVVGG